MDRHEIIILLEALNRFPLIFNHIDEGECDWLVEYGYFDDKNYRVSEKGLYLLRDLQKTA